jgi:CheY-specific phosphatase CheX
MAARFFGIHLMQKGLITREQLLDVLKYQQEHGVAFATFLQQRGLASAATLEQVRAGHTTSATGTMSGGLLGVVSGHRLLQTYKALVLHVLERGEATIEQINQAIEQYPLRSPTVSDALVKLGILGADVVKHEEAEFAQASQARPTVTPPAALDGQDGAHEAVTLFQHMVQLLDELGLRPEPGAVSAGGTLPASRIEVAVGLSGALSGRFVVRASGDTLQAVSRSVLGSEPAPDEASQIDALRELTNVAVGEACGALGGEYDDFDVNLTPPEHHLDVTSAHTAGILCPLAGGSALHLAYEPRA